MELSNSAAVLDGICEVGEAEALLAWLQAHPQGPVDVTRSAHVHTAVLQVLMATRPTLVGADSADDRRPWLVPLLNAGPSSE